MNGTLLEAATQSSPGPTAPPTTEAPSRPVTDIFAREITRAFSDARDWANRKEKTRHVSVNGTTVSVPCPFPSPNDWRDCWMYFLMIDRFSNLPKLPNFTWNRQYDYRQGGTFKGVTKQLDYLRELGVKALWLSPILKNPQPSKWQYNYHGYDTQDFLNIDKRFGSDGTLATAETELTELIEQAHGRDMYVVLDIVLNHAARVFDYVYQGQVVDEFKDSKVMYAPLGQEPPIQWMNGIGFPRADWWNQIPPDTHLSADDAVYPRDLQEKTFFRRRGDLLSYTPDPFVKGDFGQQRQLVVEYDATPPGLSNIRARYGNNPVLNILIRAYQYLIARFDFDGFRIDTVKHISEPMVEIFGNAIREFAQTLGKRNFFTFGEIYDSEQVINNFVGRHTRNPGFGIDAALDYPLFFALTSIVKSQQDVKNLRGIFKTRKENEANLISSHGEAGAYFVTFLDNHDQPQRFNQPWTPPEQITMGLAILFCLQGIPAVYYGTEQGLQGTIDKNDAHPEQSVREALWGKKPEAFDKQNFLYTHIKRLSQLREMESALRFGRLYFSQVSGNGRDFGHSSGVGGLVAFCRVLSDIEVVVVANTSTQTPFNGLVLLHRNLNGYPCDPRGMRFEYSNLSKTDPAEVKTVYDAKYFLREQPTAGDVSALRVGLAPMEVKIWATKRP
jgi:glycosidase